MEKQEWEIKEAIARLLWAGPDELAIAAIFARGLIGRITGTPGGHEWDIEEKRAKFFVALQAAVDLYAVIDGTQLEQEV